MSEEAGPAVQKVLASGFIGQGRVNDEFEAAVGSTLGTPHVVTVNSATSGLHLALYMTMTAAGDTRPDLGRRGTGPWAGEVLTTPLTCSATNWPLVTQNIRFRWVDVEATTLNMDLADLARKIGPSTRAVMVVHWAGNPIDLDALALVLDDAEDRHGFRPIVIEDCAHAWGTTHSGLRLGNHGNICVYSFQAVKHLTCGDGGAIVFPDADAARRARRLRWYGIDRTAPGNRFEQDVTEAGFKFHMNDISSAIGLANLSLAEHNLHLNRANAHFYDDRLAAVPGVTLLDRRDVTNSSAYLYSMLVEDRDGFIRGLAAAGIEAGPVHMRNDVHTCVADHREPLPGVERANAEMVSIPVGWWVGEEDRERVVSRIVKGW